MRLLDTETGQFVEKDPDSKACGVRTIYAILSHTWDKTEQTYQELVKIQSRYAPPNQTSERPPPERASSQLPSDSLSPTTPPTTCGCLTQSEVEALRAFIKVYGLANPTPASTSIWDDPDLSPKIKNACEIARKNGYRYIWIDSCCIDKSSSSELSEAINSMYKWYRLASVCYAYLADVPPGKDHHAKRSAFRKSRWFRRGWTLQELIAPVSVEFLFKDWSPIASKHALADLVESVTKIDEKALLHVEPLGMFSVAQRFSWAAERETTRVEDRAYSLLGMFNINMPTLYGEGASALRRLQEQIMQRIPDQSLFAWGLRNQYTRFSHDPTITDTPICLALEVRNPPQFQGLFAISPDFFQGCEAITNSRRDTIQLQSAHRHKITYTSTPYGICTELQMIPLTEDLLRHAIPHCEAVQLDFLYSDVQEGSQWYLAILAGCTYGEHQGHRWGRLCYVTPPDLEANVESVFTGFVIIKSRQGTRLGSRNLFLLSPETIKLFHPDTKLKTVYIPHPDRNNLLSSLQRQPYTVIKLVLLRETCDTLRSRGYSADLRNPDPAHPTTHWLTLSTDDHTITVEFKHTLENRGVKFTIDAEVKMSGSRAQLNSTPDSDQADGHTVSWSDSALIGRWRTKLQHETVRLSAAGARTLTVDLGLDFAGHGYYYLRVDVLSDPPPAFSAAKLAVDQAEEGERTEVGSPSGATDAEDADREDMEEAGGRETVPNVEAPDAAATSDNREGRDGDDVLA